MRFLILQDKRTYFFLSDVVLFPVLPFFRNAFVELSSLHFPGFKSNIFRRLGSRRVSAMRDTFHIFIDNVRRKGMTPVARAKRASEIVAQTVFPISNYLRETRGKNFLDPGPWHKNAFNLLDEWASEFGALLTYSRMKRNARRERGEKTQYEPWEKMHELFSGLRVHSGPTVVIYYDSNATNFGL